MVLVSPDANAWASEVVEGPDGRFYWFVSTRWADAPRDGDRMSIGVAVAEHPLGPYEDAIGGPLLTTRLDNASDHNIDPTVLVFDDAIHLYWGSFWSPRYVRLAESMTELDGGVRTPEGLEGFWEAPWIFERDGTFYMAYASNRNIADDGCVTSRYYACIRYATADDPAGPWRHRGIVLGQVSSTTNHRREPVRPRHLLHHLAVGGVRCGPDGPGPGQLQRARTEPGHPVGHLSGDRRAVDRVRLGAAAPRPRVRDLLVPGHARRRAGGCEAPGILAPGVPRW